MINSKYAIFSDIHLGCHCDSENWHNIVLEWAKWLKNELIEKDIEKIIICGDFFDNRNEIGVKTISVASELMDLFNDFEIIMITGNHDQFYRNRNDVHSISIFDGRTNVTIIDSIRSLTINEKKVTFIPWGEELSKLKESDVIFGHLEINGFKMSLGKLAEGKTDSKSLTTKAKLIFSGHFHLREEREYKNSKIIYVGSPYQLNWGEASNIPGYYIIDFNDLSYNFYENTISPKHIKMTSNKLKLEKIDGNIISVEIDQSLSEKEIENIKTKIYNHNPLEVKFNILRNYTIANNTKVSSNIDIFEVMMNFVDALEIDDYDKDVKLKLKELYEKYDI